MPKPNALKALDPCWFRFTEPDDAGKHGDRWYCYDEGALMRRPARYLIALEAEMGGLRLATVMNDFRALGVLGEMGVAWLGVHETDPARAGEFDEFNPITGMIEWTGVDPNPAPKAEADSASLPEPPVSSEPTSIPSNLTTSDQTDTVALSTMPPAVSQP